MTAAATAARPRRRTAMTWTPTPLTLRPSSSHLDLRDAVHVGHSTGGGEVARYVAQHGAGRVAKAVLIGAVPPLMLKTDANPGGLPIEVFDGFREGTAFNRAQFYRDVAAGPFYGFNRPGATVSEGVDPELVAARHDGRRQRPTTRASRRSRKPTSPRTSRPSRSPRW